MKKHGWKFLAVTLIGLAFAVMADSASAVWEWGCWTCRSSYIPTKPDTFCKSVPDGGSGDGIQCDDEVGICRLKGGACDNIVVTPGGGSGGVGGGIGGGGFGGGGGGGGSSLGCTLYGYGSCPLHCGTCTVVLF